MKVLAPGRSRDEAGTGVPRPGALLLAVLLVLGASTCRRPPAAPAAPAEALRLIDRALVSSSAEKDLFDLCDRFEDRVSGSRGCEAAGRWLVRRLREAGLDSVQAESFPLTDPWMPGREEAE